MSLTLALLLRGLDQIYQQQTAQRPTLSKLGKKLLKEEALETKSLDMVPGWMLYLIHNCSIYRWGQGRVVSSALQLVRPCLSNLKPSTNLAYSVSVKSLILV